MLTAGHAARRDAVWHWETNLVLETERKVMCLPLGPFTVLSTISTRARDKKVTDIDIGWCPSSTSSGSSRNFKKMPGSRTTNSSSLSTRDPSTRLSPQRRPYTFAAWNRALIIPAGVTFVERSASYETCMTYTRSNPDGLYVFKLARAHQGHEYYRGASGAPIVSPDGVLVSMVLGGDEKANEIYGLPLAKYTPLLQLT